MEHLVSNTQRRTYTVQDVAGLLGIPPNAVYRSIGRGDIPGAFRLGKKILISVEPFERFLQFGEKESRVSPANSHEQPESRICAPPRA